MSFKVTVLPSGRQFYVEGRETLLRAGMREGLNLPHQCMTGSCGGCHAKLLDGEIEQIRHHDSRLPPTADGKQQFLICCYVARSDLQIEIQELNDAADIPLQQVRCKVSRLDELGGGVVELHLKTPRSQTLEFLAGQRATLDNGKTPPLSLGMASCPCDGMHLRFHLDSQLTGHQPMLNALRKGQSINLSGPTGELTLNENSGAPLVCMAFETGFAQIQSLLDHVIAIDDSRIVYLIVFTRSSNGFYKENHLRAWRDVLDNFRYDVVYMPDNYHADFIGFLRKLMNHVPDRNHSEIYAVLTRELQQALQMLCEQNHYPSELLHLDTI